MEDAAPDATLRWERPLLLALIGAGLAVRIYFVLQPLDRLIATVLSDDSFYYYQIARNAAAGAGATFDGVIPTNGFHPLYLLLLVPLYLLFPGDAVVPVYVSLALLSLANVLTALPLYGIVRRFASARVAVVAALFWLTNPWSIWITLSGVEAALAVLLLALTFRQYLRLVDDGIDAKRLMALGALAGLTFLARTDTAIPLAVVGVALVLRIVRDEKTRAARRIATAAAPAFLLALPWVVWNAIRFGALVQGSGAVLYYRAHSQFHTAHGGTLGDAVAHGLSQLAVNADRWLLGLAGFADSRAAALFFVIAALIAVVGATYRLAPLGEPGWAKGLGTIGAGLILHWLFYAAVFWQAKTWYFLPALFGLSIAAGLAVHVLDRIYLARRKPAARAVAVFAIAAFFVGGHAMQLRNLWLRGLHPWQVHYMRTGAALSEGNISDIPADGAVGAFNSGILGYFAGRRVVNLDGVVNPRVLPAMRAGRFGAYLDEEGVDYIVDHLDLIQEYALWSDADYLDRLRPVRRLGPSSFAGDYVAMEFVKP